VPELQREDGAMKMKPLIRYVYAVRNGVRSPQAPGKEWAIREVPADLVAASTALTPAAQERATFGPPYGPLACFDGFSAEDVASVFAAVARREVCLSGGRYTREPTLWALRKR